MSLASFGALLAVWFAAIASPGPDVFQVIRLGSRSRADGVRCAVGIMIGNSLWIVGSILGLAALVAAHPNVLIILKFVGGCYLLWMGVGALRQSPAAGEPKPAAGGALWIGVTTNLANPKALVFFGAIFAQFVGPNPMSNLVIAATLIVTGFVWFVGVALLVDRFSGRFAQYAEVVAGVVFIVVGAAMAIPQLVHLF